MEKALLEEHIRYGEARFRNKELVRPFVNRIYQDLAELEELTKLKTCDGCKHNYDIDNFDSVDGKRLDSFRPNECYMCERNMQDKYEPKV